MQRRRVFRDPTIQSAFDRDGYVTQGVLPRPAIDRFLKWFDRIGRPWADGAMYSNVHVLAPEVNREIGRELKSTLEPIVEELCEDYRVDGGTLLVKGPGPLSACEIHQDWNTVDERRYTALVAWVPLVDVTEDNGCLFVAAGSHRPGVFETIRGANFSNAHIPYDSDLDPFITSLPLEAGEVCFFAQNLFHGSWPNRTAHARPALYVGASPLESEMLHYQHLGGDRFGVVSASEDFYYRGDAGRLAAGESVAGLDLLTVIEHDPAEVTREEFLEAMRQVERGCLSTRERQPVWWRRLRRPRH